MRVRNFFAVVIIIVCFSNYSHSARIWDEEGMSIGNYGLPDKVCSIPWHNNGMLFCFQKIDNIGNTFVALQIIDENGNLRFEDPMIVSNPEEHIPLDEGSINVFEDGYGGVIITWVGIIQNGDGFVYFSHLNAELEVVSWFLAQQLWVYRFRERDSGVITRYSHSVVDLNYVPNVGYTFVGVLFSHYDRNIPWYTLNVFKCDELGLMIEGQAVDGVQIMSPARGFRCSPVQNECLWIASGYTDSVNCYNYEEDQLLWEESIRMTRNFINLSPLPNGEIYTSSTDDGIGHIQKYTSDGPVFEDNDFRGIRLDGYPGNIAAFTSEGDDYLYLVGSETTIRLVRIVDNSLELLWTIEFENIRGPNFQLLDNNLFVYDGCRINELANTFVQLIDIDGNLLFGEEGGLVFEREHDFDFDDWWWWSFDSGFAIRDDGGFYYKFPIDAKWYIGNFNQESDPLWDERFQPVLSSGIGRIAVVQQLDNMRMRIIYANYENISYNIMNIEGQLEFDEPVIISESQDLRQDPRGNIDLMTAYSRQNALLASYSTSHLYFIDEEGSLLPEDELFHVSDFGEGRRFCRFTALTGDSLGGFWIALRNSSENWYEIAKLDENAEWVNRELIQPFPGLESDNMIRTRVSPENSGAAFVHIKPDSQGVLVNHISENLELRWDEAIEITPPQDSLRTLKYCSTLDGDEGLYMTFRTSILGDIDIRTMRFDSELEPLWDEYVSVFNDDVEESLRFEEYSISIQNFNSNEGDIWVLLKIRYRHRYWNQYFLQKINPSGEIIFEESGLRLPEYFGKIGTIQLIPDAEGGIWITGAQGDIHEFSQSRVIHLDWEGNPIDEIDRGLGELAFPDWQRTNLGTAESSLFTDDGLLAIFDVGYNYRNNYNSYRAQLFGYDWLSVNDANELPCEFKIENLYPNPFNSTTRLEYSLNRTSRLNISIYNVNGQLIKSVYHGIQTEGKHSQSLKSGNISSGTYFLVAEVNGKFSTEKMISIK